MSCKPKNAYKKRHSFECLTLSYLYIISYTFIGM
nr:MAG TPA: hypothetical protein [Caudoviricetes sp.]